MPNLKRSKSKLVVTVSDNETAEDEVDGGADEAFVDAVVTTKSRTGDGGEVVTTAAAAAALIILGPSLLFVLIDLVMMASIRLAAV